MKKYWHGRAVLMELLTGVGIYALFPLLSNGGDEPMWMLLGIIAAILVGGLLFGCKPLGPWTLCWVDGEQAHLTHLWTHKMRSMPLDAPYTYRVDGKDRWLVLSQKPASSVKEARMLHRQGQAMFLPLAGPLVQPLKERARAAAGLYGTAQVPGRKYWVAQPQMGRVLYMAVYMLLLFLLPTLWWGWYFDVMYALLIVIGLAAIAGVLWGNTLPVGPLKVCWVKDGMLHEQHLLTRQIRRIPLDAKHQCYIWERDAGCWAVVTNQEVPVTTTKEARRLYEQNEALIAPVAGPLSEALYAYMQQQRARTLTLP